MNKDIIYSNENSGLVFDESLIENKIENVKQLVGLICKQIEECDNVDNTCKFCLKMIVPLTILSIPTLFISMPMFITGGIVTSFLGVGTIIIKKFNTKNKNDLNAKLEMVNNLEKQYQDELSEKKNFDSTPEVSKENVITNELMPVKSSDDLDKSENETIDMIYDKVYSCDDKPKSLIKK